jgi:hypothetical protein
MDPLRGCPPNVQLPRRIASRIGGGLLKLGGRTAAVPRRTEKKGATFSLFGHKAKEE